MSEAAFVLFLLFVLSWFSHLTARVPALGSIRFDLLLLGVVVVLSAIVHAQDGRPRLRSTSRVALVGLTVYCLVTVPFVEWPGSVLRNGFEAFAKSIVFYFVTIALVSTERRLRVFLFVFIGCQAFRVAEPVYLHLTTGYWGSAASMAGGEMMDRLAGAPNDVINSNGLAFVVLTMLAFAHYLWPLTLAGRAAYLALLPVSLYALALSGSRSGVIGLVGVFVVVWLKSSRKVLLAVVALVGLTLAIPRLSPDLKDRYLSIVGASSKNAGTAQGRLQAVTKNFEVAFRRPVFGHGLGTSREANANYASNDQPSHNLYAEVSGELGFVGLGIFLTFVGAAGFELRRIRKRSRLPQDGRYMIATGDALQVWLVTNLVFSFASYGLTSYEWYLLAGLTDALGQLRPDSAVRPENAVVVAAARCD